MKTLSTYLQEIFEEEAGGGGIFATPGNTMGAGEPGFDTEPLVSTPAGGIPKKQTTKVTKRRKKSRPGLRDYVMDGPKHNV